MPSLLRLRSIASLQRISKYASARRFSRASLNVNLIRSKRSSPSIRSFRTYSGRTDLPKCAPFKSFYNRRTNSNRSNGSIARAVPNVITLNLLRKKYRRWEQVSITP